MSVWGSSKLWQTGKSDCSLLFLQAFLWHFLPGYKFYCGLKAPPNLTLDEPCAGKLTLDGSSLFQICSIFPFPSFQYPFQGQLTWHPALGRWERPLDQTPPTPAPLWLHPLPVPILTLGFRILPTRPALFLRGPDSQFLFFVVLSPLEQEMKTVVHSWS